MSPAHATGSVDLVAEVDGTTGSLTMAFLYGPAVVAALRRFLMFIT